MSKYFNYYIVLNVIGICLLFESLFMLLNIPVSLRYHENFELQHLASALISISTGIILYVLTTKKTTNEPSVKESFLIVTFSWIFISLFGTLPYLLTKTIPYFPNAFFETVSGFTTTGSSILTDVESLPKSILFWRAQTHWIGGMGIIVMVIAILPYFKIGGIHLMVAEGSFLGVEKMKPRLIDVAKRLWVIYVLLTLSETVLLRIAGMKWFDAVCHSFATIATGGFSTQNTSIMGYSPAIQYIVAAFMILSGMNFTLHYFALHGKPKPIFRNEEWRTYIFIIILSTTLVAIYIFKNYGNIEESFRYALFQVSSILTATGFTSADYEKWPVFSTTILFFIMFIGACVGSTGGGIKIARYVIAFKNIHRRFKTFINPNSIHAISYNGNVLQNKAVRGIMSFIIIYYLTFLAGSFILVLMGLDIKTSCSSVITTLGGIGPGFGQVGPSLTFIDIPVAGKFYLAFNMILGRLEILSILAIMNPSFYKV